MTISIKCPICLANNSFTDDNRTCRRCKNDLSLLYAIKYHSYIKRLDVVKFLIHKDIDIGKIALENSIKLSKGI